MAVDSTPNTPLEPPAPSPVRRCDLCSQSPDTLRQVVVRYPGAERFCDPVCFEGWTRRAVTDIATAGAVCAAATSVASNVFLTGQQFRDPERTATLLRIADQTLDRLHREFDRSVDRQERDVEAPE